MSASNGDRSRFQRRRKAGLRRRDLSRLALAAVHAQAASVQEGPGTAGADAARPPDPSLGSRTEDV
jgi:hypothetical protein